MNGYLKLHRSLLAWEWYDDLSVCRLWIHLLLRSNFTPGTWHGIPYGRGELITSLPSLSSETGLSVKQVRTALGKLKKTGEITCRGAGTGTLVAVANWDKYQSPSPGWAKERSACAAGAWQDTDADGSEYGQQDNKYNKKTIQKRKNTSSFLTHESGGNCQAERTVPEINVSGDASPLFEAMEQFRRFRSASHRPLTACAEALLLQRLSELAGDDAEIKSSILRQSIVNGWMGVFPLKSVQNTSSGDPFLKLLAETEP